MRLGLDGVDVSPLEHALEGTGYTVADELVDGVHALRIRRPNGSILLDLREDEGPSVLEVVGRIPIVGPVLKPLLRRALNAPTPGSAPASNPLMLGSAVK